MDSLQVDSLSVSSKKKFKETITVAAAYSATAFVCYRYFDTPLKNFTQANQYKAIANITHTVERAGLGTSSVLITSATAVASVVLKDKKLEKTAILLAGGHVMNDFITNQTKITFQRHRPNSGDPYNTFDWRGGPKTNTSFISSHTSNAFATATAFATVYSDSKWVPAFAYSAAALVGLCRIYDNAHWTSDVLGGAAIGFASVKAANGLYRLAQKKITFLPQVSAGHYSGTFICYL